MFPYGRHEIVFHKVRISIFLDRKSHFRLWLGKYKRTVVGGEASLALFHFPPQVCQPLAKNSIRQRAHFPQPAAENLNYGVSFAALW
jgi:hypothetical protein